MRTHPFLCPISGKPITDPVILNLPGAAALIYERSSLIEAEKRGGLEAVSIVATDSQGAQTPVTLSTENIHEYMMPFELAQGIIQLFQEAPEDPVIKISDLEKLGLDPAARSFPESPALLCSADGRMYGETSLVGLLHTTKRSPVNRKLITEKGAFFRHPLFETLWAAKKRAEEEGRAEIHLREVFQESFFQKKAEPFQSQHFKFTCFDGIKLTLLMMAGIDHGVTDIWPAMMALPHPAKTLGLSMALYAYAMQSGMPVGLFPELMHSESSGRLLAQAEYAKRYYLEQALFAVITAAHLVGLRADAATSEIHSWYDAGQSLSAPSNLAVMALSALHKFGRGYAEYWKMSMVFHLLAANRERYSHDIQELLQSLRSPRHWVKPLVFFNIFLRGAFYPMFLKNSAQFETAYFMGISYLFYRRVDRFLTARPAVQHRADEPDISFSMMDGLSKIILFLCLFFGAGKILGFSSFEFYSLLIIKLGEFAAVSELKELVSEAPQAVKFVPDVGLSKNLFRLKARVEVLPEEEMSKFKVTADSGSGEPSQNGFGH